MLFRGKSTAKIFMEALLNGFELNLLVIVENCVVENNKIGEHFLKITNRKPIIFSI